MEARRTCNTDANNDGLYWYNERDFTSPLEHSLAVSKERFMGRIGMPELFIILVIVVMIFGANRIPEIFRGVGKGIKEFKNATRDGENKDT